MSVGNNRFSNPIIKDEIEVLNESKEKLIFKTFLKPNGGQSRLHYHTKITEKFKIIEGELHVILNNDKRILKPNNEVLIKEFDTHQFYNKSDKNVVFEVEITPARHIKKALQIIYGLAKDGKVYKSGMPKNIFYMAIGLNMMDAYIPEAPRIIQKLGISILAAIGRIIGLEKKLMLQYCN
ncbi:cupin domain-containing protein [Aquimarina aquimarini]|uniref:cupin domain-containing protein n=1 Tax=Aquimarina aquimarini TaxID=1191734 RepID=UPI000D5603AD|nr:cupin domain-containing protein [Aquimarina aquimarini]